MIILLLIILLGKSKQRVTKVIGIRILIILQPGYASPFLQLQRLVCVCVCVCVWCVWCVVCVCVCVVRACADGAECG